MSSLGKLFCKTGNVAIYYFSKLINTGCDHCQIGCTNVNKVFLVGYFLHDMHRLYSIVDFERYLLIFTMN